MFLFCWNYEENSMRQRCASGTGRRWQEAPTRHWVHGSSFLVHWHHLRIKEGEVLLPQPFFPFHSLGGNCPLSMTRSVPLDQSSLEHHLCSAEGGWSSGELALLPAYCWGSLPGWTLHRKDCYIVWFLSASWIEDSEKSSQATKDNFHVRCLCLPPSLTYAEWLLKSLS